MARDEEEISRMRRQTVAARNSSHLTETLAAATTFNFLRLPAELRVLVYEHVFGSSDFRETSTSILRANEFVYADALPVLFSVKPSHHFFLYLRQWPNKKFIVGCETHNALLRLGSSPTTRLIRKVTILFDKYHSEEEGVKKAVQHPAMLERPEEVLSLMPNLNTIRVWGNLDEDFVIFIRLVCETIKDHHFFCNLDPGPDSPHLVRTITQEAFAAVAAGRTLRDACASFGHDEINRETLR